MAEKINFVAEAFKRQENIITLLGFAAAAALFQNTGFLYLAGMLEMGYLWALSVNPRFQRVVLSEKNRARMIFDSQQKERLLAGLAPADHRRYQELADIRRKVNDSFMARDSVTQSLLQPSVEKLDYLLDSFLRAQVALDQMRTHVADSGKTQLERQARQLESELKGKLSEKLREIKAKNLELLQSRLERLGKLEEELDVVKSQLETLENAIKFVGDQSVTLSDPQALTDQIDRVVGEVQDSERDIAAVESFLGAQSALDQREQAAQQDRLREKG